MKKILIIPVLVFGLMAIGISTVLAAPQVILNDTNFNLQSGHEYTAFGLVAEHNLAMAELNINSLTSGTAKNTFMISRVESGKYNVKAVTVHGLTANTCSRIDLGYIGYGTWAYSDIAQNMNTGEAWAGWSGTTVVRSQ